MSLADNIFVYRCNDSTKEPASSLKSDKPWHMHIGFRSFPLFVTPNVTVYHNGVYFYCFNFYIGITKEIKLEKKDNA